MCTTPTSTARGVCHARLGMLPSSASGATQRQSVRLGNLSHYDLQHGKFEDVRPIGMALSNVAQEGVEHWLPHSPDQR